MRQMDDCRQVKRSARQDWHDKLVAGVTGRGFGGWALVALTLLVAACHSEPAPATGNSAVFGSCEDATDMPTEDGRRLLPDLGISERFTGADKVPARRVSLDEALALKEAIEMPFLSAGDEDEEDDDQDAAEPSPPRYWRLHAFDEQRLYFVTAELKIRCPHFGCRDLVVDAKLAVERTPDTERQLGVAQEIAFWTTGSGGIRGGMTTRELHARLGPPASEYALQPAGWSVHQYATVHVIVIGCWVVGTT